MVVRWLPYLRRVHALVLLVHDSGGRAPGFCFVFRTLVSKARQRRWIIIYMHDTL